MALRFKVLVVDDDEGNIIVCRDFLEADGYSVISADSAQEGLAAAAASRPDLILMDVSMPDADGVEICRRLKGSPQTASMPVILMSGVRKGEDEQVDGIEQGADDYLPKPFSRKLLLAKVRAVLRRYAAPADFRETLKSSGLALDVPARVVSVNGRRVQLTRKEFDLLTTLLRKRGRVLSVSQLLETVWGYDVADYNDPRTVTVHISSLRRKLGEKVGRRLVSVPGAGYRFE